MKNVTQSIDDECLHELIAGVLIMTKEDVIFRGSVSTTMVRVIQNSGGKKSLHPFLKGKACLIHILLKAGLEGLRAEIGIH